MSKELFAGLPEELQDLFDDSSKSSANIEIRLVRKKYGKLWAEVSGLELDNEGIKEVLKLIKNKLATVGTLSGKTLEILFGRNDRTEEVISILVAKGFSRDSIHVTAAKERSY